MYYGVPIIFGIGDFIVAGIEFVLSFDQSPIEKALDPLSSHYNHAVAQTFSGDVAGPLDGVNHVTHARNPS